MAGKAHSKGLELAYRVDPAIPDKLMGDPARLRQIILNLVGNAVKFTEKGEVIVSIAIEQEMDDKILLHFSVKDTGIGIPHEKQGKIFSAFSQADGSTTRRYGGTGLGLSISRQLIELMGGEIDVESETGKGTTFWFTAVFGKSSEKPLPRREGSIELEDLRVLIVDDNETNRNIFVNYLKGTMKEVSDR